MAISRAKKGEIVDKLTSALKGAKSLVFVNFHGLKVSEASLMSSKERRCVVCCDQEIFD
jgi:ribosomal protein L10